MADELPPPKAVRDLFEGLLGRDVEVGAGSKVDPARPCVTAVYVDDSLTMSSVVLMDLPLAAFSGAAVGLIPVGGAEAALEDGELPRNLLENVSEILNVFAGTINEASSKHQRLYAIYPPDADVPTDAAAAAASMVNRLDLTASIKAYGAGELSCVQV